MKETRLTEKQLARLTIRARNVCRKLNAVSISKLLSLTEDKVRHFRGAGEDTWNSILRLQKQLKKRT